ncbi:hypothetical protein [Afipia felis]|uniref:dTDP-glucose 4,6 dehydratase n=2 Tax=Afipia felis TaxID=1035 RepID=A0A380W4I3_AFIFE|nr:hypothetical protein [Afipia felis]EKS30294.1 hypothetical protein HMPREF9697_02822 [Afipia felis ATCC 53690]SUU75039.1 dTDP-glucose 4,6 dehydratase [Afipia felis]SUU83105.1 dTDP-glucose 4,6 dehydratase [Afipia felis]
MPRTASYQASVLITDSTGFISSNFIFAWIMNESSPVINLDKLTYASNLET